MPYLIECRTSHSSISAIPACLCSLGREVTGHGMKILINPSGHTADNHGDTAMLLATLGYLRKYLPEAQISVINSDDVILTGRFPGVRCIRPADRSAFCRNLLPGWVMQRLPRPEVERAVLVRYPALWSRAKQIRIGCQRLLDAGGEELDVDPVCYYRELRSADVLILSGAGMINDSFGDHALTVLEEMEIAVRKGCRVYLFGQGIGPIERSDLRNKARQTLPLASRICLREKRRSPVLLREVGVRPERVTVTGDDAISLAMSYTPAALGNSLGINLRLAYYSGLDSFAAAALGQTIRELAGRLGAPLCPVPISRFATSDDLQYIYRLVIGSEPPPEALKRESVEDVIRLAGRCRVVVTGSYHAAVFALSQGVSAVCLARSAYYDDKFFGLQEMFGDGCEVIRPDDGIGRDDFIEVIERAWERAEEVRPQLIAAAESQAQSSRLAYQEMAVEISRGLMSPVNAASGISLSE